MELKNTVLGELKKHPGEYISGAELAARLKLSRTAVWKAVSALRSDGWDIQAVTNKGYVLRGGFAFTQGAISALLPEGEFNVLFFEEAASTNDILKAEGAKGTAGWTVAVAKSQSAGRGRMGRSFISPDGGLYMSILLRPKLNAADALLLTTAAAVATAEAIEEVAGVRADIKWVNDVYVAQRKVCGILTEAVLDLESGGVEYAVVGIGVNVTQPEGGFDEEIRDIAGAVFPCGQGSERKAELAARILENFKKYCENLTEKTFMDEYKRRSMLIGRDINVFAYVGSEAVPARAIGIDDELRLIVRFENGEEKALSSGEVSTRLR